MTALKFAAARGLAEEVRTLLRHGAKVDDPNDAPQTALMLAVRSGRLEVVKMLVEAGADLSRRSSLSWANGWTAEMSRFDEATFFLQSATTLCIERAGQSRSTRTTILERHNSCGHRFRLCRGERWSSPLKQNKGKNNATAWIAKLDAISPS